MSARLFVLAMASFLAACQSSVPASGADVQRASSATDGESSACDEQVFEYQQYLDVLARAGGVPERVRGDERPVIPDGLLDVSADRMRRIESAHIPTSAPLPTALAVTATPEAVAIAGQPVFGVRDPDEHELRLLQRRLRDGTCAHATHASELLLIIHPDTAWRRVRAIVRQADVAGIDIVHLAFRAEHGIAPPSFGARARSSGRTLADLYAPCGDVAELESASDLTRAAYLQLQRRVLGHALRSCACRRDLEAIRAFHYQDSGIEQTGGRMAFSITLPLVDRQAAIGDQREVIPAPPDLPWSRAHDVVIAALARGKRAYIPIDQDESVSPTLVDATPTYHRRVCAVVLDKENTESAIFGELGNASSGVDQDAFDDDEWKLLRPEDKDSAEDAERDEVASGEMQTRGSLDKAIVRHYVRRSAERIGHCYNAELRRRPELQGTVVVEFQIRADGRVVNASARGVHYNVATCVRDAIVDIRFPSVPDGGVVDVHYPITFRPPDD